MMAKASKEKLEYIKQWRADNPDKVLANARRHRKNNLEKVRESARNYARNNMDKIEAWQKSNLDKVKQYQKNFHENNPEAIKMSWNKWYKNTRNPEKERQKQRDYYARHPEKSKERRHNKRLAIPDFLVGCPIEKKALNKIYKLSVFQSKKFGVPYHVDHIWPLNDGGPHWSGNLQILLATINIKKGAKVCPIQKKQIQIKLKEAKSNA